MFSVMHTHTQIITEQLEDALGVRMCLFVCLFYMNESNDAVIALIFQKVALKNF